MDEAPELGGEHIAADDRALVDEQAGLDAALTGGVVGDLIGVPLDALAAVVGQIEALAGLEFQVLAVGLVELLGDDQLLHGDGVAGDRPAVTLQIGDPVLVGADSLGADRSGGRRAPPPQQPGGRHQYAADHGGSRRDGYNSALADLGGDDEQEEPMERLDKILANTGRWSRKEARELVRAGRVAVDGVTAQAADGKYDPAARFEVDGETVSGERLVYLMLHKPAGLVSVTEDPRQPTVLELLPQHLRRVGLFPAGRLDKDTEGLLLLTNDGPLAHRLLAPRHHVDKTYFVRVDGELDGADAAAFAAGMMLEDGLACLPAGLEVLEQPDTALVTLHEGKYHQIKRMLAARGKPVVYLKRLTMGPLMLDPALERGEWRPLSAEEVAALRQA